MFANISRHPSKIWPLEQLEAAEVISPDGIIDVAFPLVPPEVDEAEVMNTATNIASSIGSGVTAAMVQGEYTLTMFLATLLAKQGVDVYVACLGPQWTDGDGKRHRPFIRFRKIAGGNSNGEHSSIDQSGSI
jgi:hypothetical protein